MNLHKLKKISHKSLALLLSGSMLLLGACSTAKKSGDEAVSSEAAGEMALTFAANFAYASLDTHKEYYGWYTSIYGITESLYKIGDDLSLEPWLAESAEEDGNTWTITLKDEAAFSDGDTLTADIAVRNIQRVAEVNERFSNFAEYTYEVVDEKTFTVTTPEVYPTLLNDLSGPEFGMLDLDDITDYDTAIIGTGPFVISKFIQEGDVTVSKNQNYWNGDVVADTITFRYMQDDDSKLVAMQSGEISGYDSVTAQAYEVYQQDESKYSLSVVSGTRLQFYILNENRLDDNLRAAINGTVDKEAIAEFLSGTVTATDGPFSSDAAYGQVEGVELLDTEEAKALIEADGYTMGDDGYYEKDGQRLTINIAYYAARSLDTLATLMQEQLKAVGIDATLSVYEDPDSTYIATGDYDIALYCMIADKAGDPYYFISNTLKSGCYYSSGGFSNETCDALIEQLAVETDVEKRAELANEIVQIAIDENAFGYVGLFNKITVLSPEITGYASENPFDFYAVSAETGYVQ